jgi:hypothetical protein
MGSTINRGGDLYWDYLTHLETETLNIHNASHIKYCHKPLHNIGDE